ncbi:ABC transporter substrate-binding protein [Phytoactinopolyspora halotolerans]|uniref:ABC transporter substrate-binding protein n=1 Tax=Phytoactinopolyspora halotolerans TaxID=1981512 RepID=A0A6L9SB05_9ACTN|nr:ABC transporter substrate-binding protein [Phytoactinopolyspora halotolerans]NEE02337.1 ABC transporter substrate-binding protein [Phytoactinopolyspora halotolerans]
MRRDGRAYVAAAGALVLVGVACTPGDDDNGDGEGGEIVWAIGGAEAQPGGVHQSVAELWNDENPDNPVRIEQLPEEADQQREQQALELQAEGSNFDVLGVDVIWTGEYSENEWVESLEDVRGEIEEASIPGAFESATWGGELWAAPYNTNAGFLYYRTDLVDQPPDTWEALCDQAVEVSQSEDIGGFLGQGARYEGFVVNWLEYYWSAGGELYNEDQTEVLFDTEIAAQATEFMADAMENGCYAPGFNTAREEEGRNEFQQGNVAFLRNWPYVYSQVAGDDGSPANGNFDIAPLPTFTGQGTVSALGGFNNAVSAFSDNTEAAKDFVVWAATNEEAQTMLATEGSVPPTLESVYEELSDDPVMQVLGEILPDARPRPPAPEWNQISVEMQQSLFPAVNGDADVQSAVESVRSYLEGTVQ